MGRDLTLNGGFEERCRVLLIILVLMNQSDSAPSRVGFPPKAMALYYPYAKYAEVTDR